MSKHGRDFELAVYEFTQSLDSSAEVLFDHKVRDRDTGELRQCDVWVNFVFGGHWPSSILISCKDHKRKLHAGDIGTFVDEIRSTGASMGVIYSRAGFTKPAILKAEVNRIPCCRLYRNEPAEVPQSIFFDFYTCNQKINLSVKAYPSRFTTWGELFETEVETDNGQRLLVEVIEDIFHREEAQSIEEAKANGTLPNHWGVEVKFDDNDTKKKLHLIIIGNWRYFQARLEARLLNGSYSLMNESFRGTIASPIIDAHGTHPGEGWIEFKGEKSELPKNRLEVILYKGKVVEALQQELGTKPLPSQLK